MATKKEFDLVQFTMGYRKFVVPKDMAMALWELMANAEVYEIESNYRNNKSSQRVHHITPDNMPTISSLSAVQFHTMLAAQEVYEEEEAAKEAAKNA